jgi:hypothetical protein
MAGVQKTVRIEEPYKLAGRTTHPVDTVIEVRDVTIGGPERERNRLARQLGITETELAGEIECDPQNSVVALINPDGYLLALFTAVTDPSVIARDLRFFQ